MFDLEKLEKKILIFLLSTLLVGVGVIAYKKMFPTGDLSISFARPSGATPSNNAFPANKKININNASADELMSLKGVGKVLAERIVEYRMKKGLFISADDIKNVPGIGDKLFSSIKDSISLE